MGDRGAKNKNVSKSKINKFYLGCILVFIWPFIYCFNYVFANESFSLTIGNDFWYIYNCKVYLLDKLSNFNLPLWSPSEGSGIPFFSNPFTQVFYPLNALLVAIYEINNGYSYADHQKFTVLGLSIFALGLLYWLRSLHVNIIPAILAVCIVSASSKIIEIMRFPNAVHTIAWVPFILYGCTLALNNAKQIKSGLIIFVSVILMITAGYPYNAYYSFFLIFPYILVLIFAIRKKYCFKEYFFNLKRYLLTLVVSFVAAFAICYPYIRSVKTLMDQIGFRGGNDFEFSTFFKFTLTDTVGSLIYPPIAHIEGWYYFGMMSILIVICMCLYMIINRIHYKKQLMFSGIILVWFITITYITYGENSYLFKFLWEYFPSFSRLRVWPRMSIILLPVFAYLLSSAFGFFSDGLNEKKLREKKQDSRFKYFVISVILIYAIILFVQVHFFNNKVFDERLVSYSKGLFENFNEKIYLITSVVSFALLISFLFASRFIKNKKTAVIVFFVAFFIVNVFDLYMANSRQWSLLIKPDTVRKKIGVDELNSKSLLTPRTNKISLISTTPVFSVVGIEEWYYERYENFLKNYSNDLTDTTGEHVLVPFEELMGLINGKRIFCSNNINYETIKDFLVDSKNYESSELIKLQIEKYNGDELAFMLETNENGYCTFIDNWDSDWKASVNEKEIHIEKLFGTFKSVKIEKGINKVVFKYSPKIFSWF